MNKQEKIKMPNRVAKHMRNSPQLSNFLDGDGVGLQVIEDQQKRAAKEIEKTQRIRDAANVEGDGPTARRVLQPRSRGNAAKTKRGETEVFYLSADDFEVR